MLRDHVLPSCVYTIRNSQWHLVSTIYWLDYGYIHLCLSVSLFVCLSLSLSNLNIHTHPLPRTLFVLSYPPLPSPFSYTHSHTHTHTHTIAVTFLMYLKKNSRTTSHTVIVLHINASHSLHTCFLTPTPPSKHTITPTYTILTHPFLHTHTHPSLDIPSLLLLPVHQSLSPPSSHITLILYTYTLIYTYPFLHTPPLHIAPPSHIIPSWDTSD